VIEHLRDISYEKNAEEERLKLLEKLKHAQKMEAIGTLAGGIAHDFNNLLMGVLGNVSLLLQDIDPHEPEYDKVKNIEEFAKSGAELTNQLLGLARGGRYEVRPTDVKELIRSAADMFGRTKKEIQIQMKFDPDVWTVEVDQAQIKQVALNIFVNAWQAMPEGGNIYVEIKNTELDLKEVAPHGLAPGRYVQVAITDTGVGMSPEAIHQIFDPFFTTKSKERGTGLGLASAYGIIKNHAGIITASSSKNKGATLTFYLPATNKKVIESKERSQQKVEGSGTILLIDDEKMILEIGRKMIERLGYQVLTACGGKEGIEVFRAQPDRIDAVVLDMIMPGMGGEKTFGKLKKIRPDIPVLLSSGYSIDDKAKRILDQGCSGFIQKPYSLVELSQKLKEMLV
jgi:nitrogen-specific signal transduction histidine kinase